MHVRSAGAGTTGAHRRAPAQAASSTEPPRRRLPRAPAVTMRGITKRFPGVRRERRTSTSRRASARSTRCSARTAPARARSRTSSPACTAPTRASSSSTGEPVDFQSPRDALDAGHRRWCTSTSGSWSRSRSPRTSCSAITATSGARSALHPRAIEQRVAELGERYGLAVDPRARIWQLSVGEQQRVEILKALYREARDPDPRRADRGADAAGGRGAVRDAARDGGRGPHGDLHLPQAARGDGGRRPRHRAARRPLDRHRRRPPEPTLAVARRADGRPRASHASPAARGASARSAT